EDRRGERRARQLADYSATVLNELTWVDEITGTCFACFDRFEVMVSVAMLYFVATVNCEERERAGQAPIDAAFLLADDREYRQIARKLCLEAERLSRTDAQAFTGRVHQALQLYNSCGLCDPKRDNLYPFLGARF